ncbi:MAG: cell division protein ZapD [Enterobacteriaceae bacterium]
MCNSTQTMLFEYPLNEKMRTWLRVEFLLQQLTQYRTLSNIATTLSFFKLTNELLDVLERGDIRSEILKEIERQQKKLQVWADAPNADKLRIEELQQQLKQKAEQLHKAPRLGQKLKEDKLISSVRQRLSIPGGCCSFDLPALHMWINSSRENRDQHVHAWMETFIPLEQALQEIMQLIRQSAPFRAQTSINGFFQDNSAGADLLRMNLDLTLQLYPQVSGHKTRYVIRFMPLDSEKGVIPESLQFDLACC